MRRLRVLVTIFLVSCLSRSIRAQPHAPTSGGDFRAVPDDPSQILARLNELSAQREDAYRRGFPYDRYGLPDSLDRYVADLWRRLGVPDKWDGHCPSCYRSTLEAMVASSFVVLRMQIADWDWRFLVFVAPEGAGAQWRLARYADTEAKYKDGEFRMENVAGRSFLVIDHDTGGTGAAEYADSWYALAPSAQGVALDIPTTGHDEFPDALPRTYVLTRDWESEIVHRPETRDDVLRVALTVHYRLWGEGMKSPDELFARRQSAVFIWDATAGRFRFEASRSDLSEEELHDVYREYGVTAETFAQYNAQDVNRILDSGTEEEKRAFAALGIRRQG